MRGKLGWTLVNFAALGAMAWLAAAVVNNVLRAEIVALPTKPQAVVVDPTAKSAARLGDGFEAETISGRNLFNSEPPELEPVDDDEDEEAPAAVGGEPPGPDEDCEAAEGDAVLVATMVADPKRHSRALVDVGSDESRILRAGSSIEPGTVVAIHRQRLVLRGADGYACLKLGEQKQRRSARPTRRPATSHRSTNRKKWDEGINKTGENAWEIDRNLLVEELDGMDALTKGVRMVPHSVGGRNAGFKMVRVRSNSIYFKLGLRSRDVLTGANGEEIRSPNEALKLLDGLKNQDRVTIDIKRRGKPVTLEYQIK